MPSTATLLPAPVLPVFKRNRVPLRVGQAHDSPRGDVAPGHDMMIFPDKLLRKRVTHELVESFYVKAEKELEKEMEQGKVWKRLIKKRLRRQEEMPGE